MHFCSTCEPSPFSIELLSNGTFKNLVFSLAWSVNSVRMHTLPRNPDLMVLGIVLLDVGIVIVLLTIFLPGRLANKTSIRK